jgi:periplasmic protein TonB
MSTWQQPSTSKPATLFVVAAFHAIAAYLLVFVATGVVRVPHAQPMFLAAISSFSSAQSESQSKAEVSIQRKASTQPTANHLDRQTAPVSQTLAIETPNNLPQQTASPQTTAAENAPSKRQSDALSLAAPSTPPRSETKPAETRAPQFDVDYLNNPAPNYPALSRRSGEQGRVLLRVFVDELGAAKTVEISHSSGFPRLDIAAAEAVRQWRFVAAHRGDENIAAWVLVPIHFNLRA